MRGRWLFVLVVVVLIGIGWFKFGVNSTDEHGMTTLMRAARAGDEAQVKAILRNPLVSIDKHVPNNALQSILSVMGGFKAIPDRDPGWTALFYASKSGHPRVVKLLLDEGADPNARDLGGSTALNFAPDAAVTKLLLDAGARTEPHGSDQGTPLLYAAMMGNREKLALLIEARANVNATDMHGMTALHHVARRGDLETARMLIAAGADLEIRDKRSGWTPAMWALETKNEALAALLRSKGAADPSASRALVQAAINGDLAAAQEALRGGASPDSRDSTGTTALLMALRRADVPMMRLLIEAGADVDARDSIGKTALYWAAPTGKPELVKLLLDAGANAKGKDSYALAIAGGMGDLESVKLLLGAGADVNVGRGEPLRYSAWQGRTEVVRALLAAGADPNLDADGMTALMRASGLGHTECVRLLLAAGANPNAVDPSTDYSALAAARAGRHEAVIQLLVAAGAVK